MALTESYNDNTSTAELAELSQRWMSLYGININLQRAIPMLVDGLKPIHRRILYTIYKNYGTNKFKVGTAIGLVLGIHPHGDQGLGEVFARMAQEFSNNIPLLSTTETGNSGNAVAGDDYASPRYLDMKMSKFAYDILFDEFDGKVNMVPTYDNSKMEPFVLPAKFPIILLNGSSGIGYTLSSDILPYNLNDIADATIKLLKNPDAKIRLVPDSPTGCDIITCNDTSFIMQSSFDIDNVNYIITIKNTPYMRYLDDISKKLYEIQDSSNPIKEIIAADDDSDLINDKIRYVIRCKPCNLYNILNVLFKRVPGLRVAVNTSNAVVVDPSFRAKNYNPRQILCAWIHNRLKEKRAWFLRELVSTTTHHNMLEGKAYMLSPENINKTVKTIRACGEKSEIVPALVEAYKGKVTTSQANYLSEIKVYNMTNGEYNKTLSQIKEVLDKIEYINSIVYDAENIRNVIIDEIKEIKNKYGTPRKSKILNSGNNDITNIKIVQLLTDGSVLFGETENPEHLSSDITPISGEDVCLIDDRGRFTWVSTNKVEHDKPLTLTSIGKEIMSKCVAAASNKDNDIIILTNQGRIKYMPIGRIPSNATKKPLLPLNDDERIVSILELHDNLIDNILVYTNDGLGKRIQISDLNKVLSVDAAGQFILKDYEVAGMFIIDSSKPLLVYVTKLGRLRVNQSKFLSTVKKFAEPKSIIKLSQQDDLIAVFCAMNKGSVVLNHADGRITTVGIESLGVSTMATPAVKPKHVPGVRVLRATVTS